MATTPIIWLVVNSASGSYSDDALAALEADFASAGRPLARVVSIPEHDAPDRAALEAAKVDVLAIYTGDGTINSVVSGLYEWAGQVLILPGGTQNLLAKALHGDRPAAEIIAALGRGELTPTTRQLVRTSQGDAFCEVLAGPGARWSDVREAMRDGDLGAMASTLGEALGQTSGGAPVRLVEPALGNPDGYPAVRLHPEGGEMWIDGYAAQTIGEYAEQGMALLRRDFREGPHDELGVQQAIVCRADDAIELMIDGERKTGGHEERFELRECPVEFLSLCAHPNAA